MSFQSVCKRILRIPKGPLLILLASGVPLAWSQPDPGTMLPTGQTITPLAAKGAIFESLNPNLAGRPEFTAGQASALSLSPDQRTLIILTSGYNRNNDAEGRLVAAESNEYAFVYDVAGDLPVQTQVLEIPNTLFGLTWAPAGDRFFVSGGVDDVVYEFVLASGNYKAARIFHLGHKEGVGLKVSPGVSGIAVSPDGEKLLAANYQNDSVTLIDLKAGTVTAEHDLRPGVSSEAKAGAAGGTFPRAVIWSSNTKAYVASERDRELIELRSAQGRLTVGVRIKTPGQPVAFVRNKITSRIFIALDNTDSIAALDPVRDRLIEIIPTAAPRSVWPNLKKLGGAGTNALDLSPDGRTLLVSNAGENAVAVIGLDDRTAGIRTRQSARDADDDDRPHPKSRVLGLIPTGWYPTGIAARVDGRLFIVNAKSVPGPNPQGCRKTTSAGEEQSACLGANQYVWQLQKAGFLTIPMPSGAELARLTMQVARNDGFPDSPPVEDPTIAFLRAHVHHVIYILKENRGYDQVLGDLGIGNGDPRLTLLPEPITPNHHALAREFVTLDAFFDSGESSNTGWNWSTAARTNDFTEREAPINYAGRGLQYDQEGNNRNINVGYKTNAERVAANPATPPDPNIMAGTADVAAPDGPNGEEGRGYLWDAALKGGKTVRNYGFYGDLSRYSPQSGAKDGMIPLEREPFKNKLQVFFPAKSALQNVSDPYFRGFDQAFPDYWRYKEWEREFDGYTQNSDLPALTLVRLPHDHFGSFKKAIDGVNTVEAEMADNDYAVGLLVEKVAKSQFASDTLIFVLEDDAQNGADHVDAHRSIAFVAGPYVKQHQVISKHYDTVEVLRTMEDILQIGPMGLNDGLAKPMTALFDANQEKWSYEARIPALLHTTALPLPADGQAASSWPQPKHNANWWEAAMAGQNFAEEDRLDTPSFNKALWLGLRGTAIENQGQRSSHSSQVTSSK